MSRRAAAWLGWTMCALTMALTVAALRLEVLNNPTRDFRVWQLALLAYPLFGALIMSRRPENPIGWLICVSPLFWAFGGFASHYGVYALVTAPGSLPAGRVIAALSWFQTLGWGPMLTFLLLLFPTGQLPSPRWRPIAWLIAALIMLFCMSAVIWPGPIDPDYPSITNPFGIEGAASVAEWIVTVGSFVFLALVVVCVISVVLRFRRAQGEEREQLKWFAYAAVLLIILVPALPAFTSALPLVARIALQWLVDLAFAAPPVAIGIAILKYRLFNIDIIINRTLVYGAFTAALALTYYGSVVVLQQLFRALTGQTSDLAIVASTLIIAALFNPLRRRIQEGIDRRFYRRKYDAAKTLAAFSATVHDEVDLQRLSDHLVAVVEETMQPAHVSLWLRKGDKKR